MEQIEDKKYFLEYESTICISRAEIEKYFVQFLVQMKTVEFAFEIIWPLVSDRKLSNLTYIYKTSDAF